MFVQSAGKGRSERHYVKRAPLEYSGCIKAESEKPRQRVSIAVRKVFAKIRKVFAIR